MRWFLLIACLVGTTACARRYATSGMVLAVRGQQVTVSHREIPGKMPAMTMTLTAPDPRGLVPGSQVDFLIRPSKRGSRMEKIRRRATLGEGLVDGMRLQPPPTAAQLGQPVPDFILPAHDGALLDTQTLRGQVVAVNFIYTRCPLPDVCPRLTAHFARLQKRFAGRPVRFLTVTLDPRHDTPAVLADYAKKWRADAGAWRFLTGTQEQIDRVAASFGMLYWPEGGQLVHTSSTGVLDRTGRLVALIEGTSYDAAQLGDLLDRLLNGE